MRPPTAVQALTVMHFLRRVPDLHIYRTEDRFMLVDQAPDGPDVLAIVTRDGRYSLTDTRRRSPLPKGAHKINMGADD